MCNMDMIKKIWLKGFSAPNFNDSAHTEHMHSAFIPAEMQILTGSRSQLFAATALLFCSVITFILMLFFNVFRHGPDMEAHLNV